jgi:hypothetical protein
MELGFLESFRCRSGHLVEVLAREWTFDYTPLATVGPYGSAQNHVNSFRVIKDL